MCVCAHTCMHTHARAHVWCMCVYMHVLACVCVCETTCPSEERGVGCWLCPGRGLRGQPLPGAGGRVPSLVLLFADLRGNKKGSERLAGGCLCLGGLSSHTFTLLLGWLTSLSSACLPSAPAPHFPGLGVHPGGWPFSIRVIKAGYFRKNG